MLARFCQSVRSRRAQVYLIRILKTLITKLPLTDDEVCLLQLFDLSLQSLQTRLDYWIEVLLVTFLVQYIKVFDESLPCTRRSECHRR